MERPIVDMWEKDYAEKHKQWVIWHVNNTEIDNKKDFVRWFMQYSKGRVNPQTVIEAWDFKEGVDRMKKYHENTVTQFRAVMDCHIANIHSPFYEKLLREQDVNPE